MIVVSRIDRIVGESDVAISDYRGVLGVFKTMGDADTAIHSDVDTEVKNGRLHPASAAVTESRCMRRGEHVVVLRSFKNLSDAAKVHENDPYSRQEGTLIEIEYEYTVFDLE